jgi:hypothetical protein
MQGIVPGSAIAYDENLPPYAAGASGGLRTIG